MSTEPEPPSPENPSGGEPGRERKDGVGESEVTRLLWQWKQGDHQAFDRLFPLVYEELRQLAHCQMARETSARTLQPTALVHESYLRLVDADVDWEGRSHFLAIAARVMRQILVDVARQRRAMKRGAEFQIISLDEGPLEIGGESKPAVELLALDQALTALAAEDERRARIVEMRLFAGLTIEEVGKVLGVSHATVERDARVALAWLRRRLAARSEGS